MLAGDMNLKTFLALVAVGVVCSAGGVAVAAYTMKPDVVVVETPAPQLPNATVASEPVPLPTVASDVPADPAATPAPSGLREVDDIVLGYAQRKLSTDKLKDVTAGKAFKVNVYQDAGSDTVNRVKVDLDRDDKWDEKFSFKDGVITRDVAPEDDEAYTISYRWDGKTWVAGP